MKKYLILIILLTISIPGCEKDDICLEETTPDLIIRFYDFENRTAYKQVTNLTVWAIDKDSIYTNQALDSIYIPLDINSNNTFYNLQSGSNVDEITFAYNRSDVYVSRSCGYKTIYENLQIENNTSNWIKEIEINNTTVDNDTIAQITIFH